MTDRIGAIGSQDDMFSKMKKFRSFENGDFGKENC